MRKLIDLLVGLLVAAALWSVSSPAPAQQPVVPYSTQPGKGRALEVSPSPFLLNGLTSTPQLVSASPARLGIVYCYNNTAAPAYLQIFDAASTASVTVGSTTPVLSLGIPTVQASGTGPALIGVQFLKGIVVASTTSATGSTSATQDCNVTFN